MTPTVKDYGATESCQRAAVGVTTIPTGGIVVFGGGIHPREQWLWANAEALRSVMRGGAEAAEGDTRYLGSFVEFLDIDIDD